MSSAVRQRRSILRAGVAPDKISSAPFGAWSYLTHPPLAPLCG